MPSFEKSVIQPNNQRDPVEVLCEEFVQRWRDGESPTIEQYAAAHREIADDIHAIFPALLAMENVREDRSQNSSDRPIQLHVERLEQLGDYRILREIGRGGMAIVYEALQQSLNRRVAVKVYPQQAFDDTKHLKRFQREAQTIGCLHHNNIVPVFGIGEQDGLHYFVMQLLDGVSLDHVIRQLKHYTDEQKAPLDPMQQIVCSKTRPGTPQEIAEHSSSDSANPATPKLGHPTPAMEHSAAVAKLAMSATEGFQRDKSYWRRVADLGRQIAEGLEYAHQQNVLHRDIKPANLVIDNSWRVWITDFGLATGFSAERLSHTGDIVGTLRYMAPERLSGKADPRSDIYSLGLTIYELATFQAAFDADSRGQLTQQVLNGTPPAPRQILKDIPADLETIILKAINRSPNARYQTAAELALDFENFSNDLPIHARRVSKVERLGRWSLRNPAMAALSTALMLCIVLSLAITTSNWRGAVREKRNAETQSVRAENNLSLALDSMERFLSKFESDWMAHPLAADAEASESVPVQRFAVSAESANVLQEALLFYQEFAKQNSGNPRLKRDTAKAFSRTGGIHERLGRLDLAEDAYRSAVNVLASIAPETLDDQTQISIAKARNDLALVLGQTHKHDAALKELMTAKAKLTPMFARESVPPEARYELALTNSHLGSVHWWLRDGKQASQRHRNAIVILEELTEEFPSDAHFRLALARANRDYYYSIGFWKDSQYTNKIRDVASSLMEDLVAEYPNVPDYRCELSEMLSMPGRRNRKQHAENSDGTRLKQLTKAASLGSDLAAEYPSIPRYRAAWAKAMSEKARLLDDTSDNIAIKFHGRAVKLYTQLSKQYPKIIDYRHFAGCALKDQAECLRRLKRTEQARTAYSLAISEQRDYVKNRTDSIFAKKWLADYLNLQSEFERSENRIETAEALEREADSLMKKHFPPNKHQRKKHP